MAETLFKPTLRGPMRTRTAPTEANPWAGRTVLASGSATVTVSTATVQSDSIITFSTEVGTLGVNSGAGIVVTSIADAVSFMFGRASGQAVAWDETIMWSLMRTSYTN